MNLGDASGTARALARRVLPAWARRGPRSYPGAVYALLRLWRGDRLLQDDGFTRDDRYPAIFAFVRETLGDGGDLLSFGCSTGEEVFSLRRRFASARILGLDIHPGHIATCRARLSAQPDARISFAVASDTRGIPDASLDAVFCMAVLRRGDLASHTGDRCDRFIRFETFERHVADFARILRPGGLLAIRGSNFRLRDAEAANRFEVVMTLPVEPDPRSPLYGCDNRRLGDQAYGEFVFRRL